MTLERLAQVGHGGGFIHAQFAIAIDVPIGHANILHTGVGKLDNVPLAKRFKFDVIEV